MPVLFNYTCKSCRRTFATHDRADATTCPECQGPAIRNFSFSIQSGMKEHWNNAVGQYVSNRQDMGDALKRQSEEMSIRTGITHDYQMVEPADMRDAGAHGVDEGNLEVTRKRHRDLGLI